MYCRKCEKSLPADSTFCPYCGNEKLEAEEVAASAAEETSAEESATEESAAEETAAAEAAPSENEAAADEAVEEAPAPTVSGDRVVEGKSGKGVVIGVLAAVVIVLAAVVAFLAGRLMGNDKVPDSTGEAPSTTDVADDAELFPSDYTVVYPDGFSYSGIDLSQYIELGDYENLTLTLTTSSEITDADVDDYIANVLAQHSEKAEVTDRAAQNGDEIVIDYSGAIDGVVFDGGTATDQTITLGAGGFIDGFEEGIVGMKVGETKVIDTVFPEVYPNNPDLAGKTAQFTITLHSISEYVTPEYNDTFVRDNFDYATMPEYEAYVREVLAENREAEILAEKQSGLLDMVTENSTVLAYPEGVVEDYMYQQIDYMKYYGAMYYGMEYSEFIPAALGMTAAEYEAEVRASAELAVKQELVIFALYNEAGLTVTDEERAEAEQYYIDYYEAEDIASLCQTLGVSEAYFANTIDFSTVYTAVMDYLTENATYLGAK